MTRLLVLLVLVAPVTAAAGPAVEWTPFVQQTAAYYSSDTVTAGGAGIGAGVRAAAGGNLVAQADAGVLWGNGNSVTTRLALGYQRAGRWTPALYGTFGLYWGHRTEVLTRSGERPAIPVWVAGVRVAPLRFSGGPAAVSALELGYGAGPDDGRNIEVTILSADFRW